MLVINLWGAPSSGKSTTAAGVFFLLKINKWRVELASEFAKELVWEGNEAVFGDQAYIFSEQNRRLRRLVSHGIDAVVTDSPLPLPAFYQDDDYLPSFTPMVFEQFHRYNNVNYLLKRTGSFETIGRRHDEAASERIDRDMRAFMKTHQIDYTEIEASPHSPQRIFEDLQKRRAPAVVMPLVPPATPT